jgi:hypothetical protein
MGFYPFPENFLVGNDDISSIKVGSGVRLRAYRDAVYAGGWTRFTPGTRSGGLGTWNDIISSIRVEPANRSEFCNDVQQGEIALFDSTYYQGDCVVLPGGAYPNPSYMGIADNTISALINKTSKMLWTYADPDYNPWLLSVSPQESRSGLPAALDNKISSMNQPN